MYEANPQHVNALSSPCSAKPPETNDTTEQGSTRMARGGAWQREVNATPATVLRVKRDRKRRCDMGRMLCICTFNAHLATHPGLPFYYGPPTHGGRNLRFERDSMATVVANQTRPMTHGTIVPDSS